VTYRDDREAALERAEALQHDLDRAEADRDRERARAATAEAELDRLRAAIARPPEAMVLSSSQALSSIETRELVRAVGVGLRRARGGDRALLATFLVIALASVPVYALAVPFALAITLVGVFGATIMGAGQRVDPTTHLITAVREHPESIAKLRLVGGGARSYLVIETADAAGACRSDDPVALLAQLVRRCPDAKVEGQ